MLKTCLRCKTPKEVAEFGKETRRKDGRRPYCRECAKAMTAEIREDEAYREAERGYARQYNDDHKGERRDYRELYQARPETKEKIRQTSTEWQKRNPIKKILYRAAASAKEHSVPFDLEEADISIPATCPILDIKIAAGDGHSTANSPSIDRVIPALGYVKTNVRVISHKANTIKNNATVEELRKVADWLEKTLQSVESSPA